MRFSGCSDCKNKITIIGTIVFINAILFYIVIYMIVLWSENSKLLQKQLQIEIKPKIPNFPLDQLEPNDKEKLMNITGFKFIKGEIICGSSDVFLLVLVPSAPRNKLKRNSIRKTWGRPGPDVKILFMLGYSENKTTELEIEDESKIYSDIVQGNFIDSYMNLTYKSVMSLKYVVYHCPQATYVLKVDDDSFVNMPILINFLKHDIASYNGKNVLLCNDMTRSPVIRETGSPWYVPVEDFPDQYFPSYCSGWYAIFTPDIAFKLYKASQTLKYLFIEDAFIYGIAGQTAKVTHVDMSYYTFRHRKEDLLFNGTYDAIPILFGFPNMEVDEVESFYEYFKNRPMRQSVFNYWKSMGDD